MLKRSPLFETQRCSGADFLEFRGREIPNHYGSLEEEYAALKHEAGLIDLSVQGIIELQGRDRSRFLHGMVTNDIQNLSPGQGCYALMLTPRGRILTDMRVLCLEDSLMLVIDSDLVEKDLALLRKYIISDQVDVIDRSADLAMLSLQGPKAAEVIGSLCSEPVLPETPFEHRSIRLGDTSVRCARIRRTGAGGYDLILAPTRLVDLWNALLQNGARLGLCPAGLEAWNVDRLEAGIAWYGFDMDEARIPLETGLEDAISFTKGCYIGQEVVARATYHGQVHRKLRGLLLCGRQPAGGGDKIFRDGREVGWVTGSAYSPRLQRAIALAYVRREAWDPGTTVGVESRGALSNAEVTTRPFD
jgi:aminomethyltransferase